MPSTLIPYANFFVGFGNPQPLVDGFGAGILKNVGINFETDALTGYPKLNDTGANAWGGAIGVQYLFNLDQQLIFEAAMVQPFGDPIAGIGIPKRSTASVCAIKSRSAGPGCSAPTRPIRSSRAAKTTSASASSCGGSFDGARNDDSGSGAGNTARYRMSSRTLFAIMLVAFVLVAGIGAATSYLRDPPDAAGSGSLWRSRSNGEMLARLKDYTGSLETEEPASTAPAGKQLPDVSTMIERLAARLETTPEDVKGWRMLGWSYFNTGRYEQAAAAYAKAAALDPNSAEIKRLVRAGQGEGQRDSFVGADPGSRPRWRRSTHRESDQV